jgi:repressor LexA
VISPAPLSAKEKKVLEYLEKYFRKKGIAPSFQEIKDHFEFASFNSVQRYLQQLQKKNYINLPGQNQKRALTLLNSSKTHLQGTVAEVSNMPTPAVVNSYSLPLLGHVAAGQPLEALEHNEFVDVPPSLVRDPQHSFALKVQGQSMIEDGIFDGDIILVKNQEQAENGDIVVAIVDNEATVKRFYFDKKHGPLVELRPSNANMKSMWFPAHEVEIRGVVVGLIRKF